MSFLNQIGQVTKKLVDYSVYNSPTQIALQAMGQYGGGNRGPMSASPAGNYGNPAAVGGNPGANGTGGPDSRGQSGLSQQGYVQRDAPEGLIGRAMARRRSF